MKTVIDAVNYFKGKTTDDFIFESTIDHQLWKKGMLVGGDTNPDSRMFIPVCTINQFYQCVREMSKAEWMKPVTSPIYTQTMADNGELPSVGMECFVKRFHEDDCKYLGCYIIGFSQDKAWLVFEDAEDHLSYHNILNGTFTFRPLLPITPPIELIDGERYEFDADTHTCLGFYYSDRNSFFTNKLKGNKICGKSEASNIKLLEVKS